MSTNDSRIYLASGSPRRREILEGMGLSLERIHAEIDESVLPGEDAITYTERLAREKAAAGWEVVQRCGLPERPLLAADTTVVQDGEIFGKPVDAADARRMLLAFSGRSHQAVTSVAVRQGDHVEVRTSVTDVTFKPLSEAESSAISIVASRSTRPVPTASRAVRRCLSAVSKAVSPV